MNPISHQPHTYPSDIPKTDLSSPKTLIYSVKFSTLSRLGNPAGKLVT